MANNCLRSITSVLALYRFFLQNCTSRAVDFQVHSAYLSIQLYTPQGFVLDSNGTGKLFKAQCVAQFSLHGNEPHFS